MGIESLQEESVVINVEKNKGSLPFLSSLKKWWYKIMKEEEV